MALREHSLTDEAGFTYTGRNEVGAGFGGLEVLKKHLVARHGLVHGGEPVHGAGERHEEQASVKATLFVGTIDEVECTAQHTDATVLIRVHVEYVGTVVDDGTASLVGGGEIWFVEFVGARQWSTLEFITAGDTLLLLELQGLG